MNWTKTVVGIVIVIVVIAIIAWGVMSMGSNPSTSSNSGTTGLALGTTSNLGATTTPNAVKFSDSPGYPYALEILPTMDPNTQSALSGINITQSIQSDGSTVVTVTSSEYNLNNQINVPSDSSLYFIEKMSADDSGTGDRTLNDDYFVLVDSSGNISQEYHPAQQ